MGDINADILRSHSYPTTAILNTLALAGTRLVSDIPTRVTSKSATCIDIIAVNEDIVVKAYQVIPRATSDHFPVTSLIVASTPEKLQPIVKRSFNKVDFSALSNRVAQIDISNCDSSSPDDLLNYWQTSFIDILDEFAPIRKFPMRRHRSPWLNGEIRELIKHRDYLAKQVHKFPSPILEADLKIAKQRVKSRIRREAKEQGSTALTSRNPTDAWNFIKSATFTAKGGDDILPPLQTLNNHFASVVQAAQDAPLTAPSGCDKEDCFQFSTLTPRQVQKALRSLKSTSAPGHDKFPGFLFKNLAEAIAPNITHIYNSSFLNNIFPNTWKMADIRAIYKQKGSKTDPNNYRPISVLPILGRTLEKLAAAQLYQYCELNSILPPEQFGFRKHSSCEMALLSATESCLEALDQGSYVGALLIDLSKAFDTVPHQRLLVELLNIGCSSDTTVWFCNYLSDRLQRVILYDEVTTWLDVSRGFPQGSGLSPLLFNIFVRKLPQNCTSKVFQFADDTTLMAADSSLTAVADILTDSFNTTKEFCDSHNLNINTNKTQLIVFKASGKKLPDDFHLTLNGCIIKPQPTVKLLGLTLDHHLTFGPQIDNVVSKCNGLLGMLARAAPYLPKELLKLTYTAVIRTHLEYCSSLYLSVAKTHLKKLDIIQKKAARVIYQVRNDTHAGPLLILLGLDSLKDRREAHITKLFKSFHSGKSHPAMASFADVLPDGSLAIRQSRTSLGRKRPSVVGATIYNHRHADSSETEDL